MKIKEIIETIDYIKSSVAEDFKKEYKRDHKNNTELLDHIKNLYKNGLEDSILENIDLDDINCPRDIYKFLLVSCVYNSN